MMVKCLNKDKLNGRVDTPWRSHLLLGEEIKPEWRSVYKPPLTKKVADLQWRVLHGIVAVNAFICVMNQDITDKCPFCPCRETVFHCFLECKRLEPLFMLLERLFGHVGEIFSKQVFILGFKYKLKTKQKSQIMNFILGQAKMAIYISRKKKIENSVEIEADLLFRRMVKARIKIDFNFYKAMKDFDQFQMIWTYGDILCSVIEDQLFFALEFM